MDPSKLKEQKEQMIEERKAAHVKRKGVYKTWSKTDSFKDLMDFIITTEANYLSGGKRGLGLVDGKQATLTNEQRMSLIDKADGIGIIKTYIENNMS